MDFDFSDDQAQLRDAVRKWVDKSYGFDDRRQRVAEGGFSQASYQAMAELGLTGLWVQEAYGGMGMGPVESMVVMEELGRGIVLEPLHHAIMAGVLLGHHAPPELAQEWGPRLAAGEALMVLAHQERKARYRLEHCETTAQAEGQGYRLTGHKSIVAAGDQADAFIVPALLQGRMALFVVSADAAGVTRRGYLTQDGARGAELTLNQSPASLLTEQGLPALEHAVDVALRRCAPKRWGSWKKLWPLPLNT